MVVENLIKDTLPLFLKPFINPLWYLYLILAQKKARITTTLIRAF